MILRLNTALGLGKGAPWTVIRENKEFALFVQANPNQELIMELLRYDTVKNVA